MLTEPEISAKIDSLASIFAEMKSVRVDAAALKDEADKDIFDGGSSTLSLRRKEVSATQKRLNETQKGFKKEFERLQAVLTMLLDMVRIHGISERPTKRIRQRLPQLPQDVVVLILSHVSVPDIRNSQLVCRTWSRAINEHALELWEKRCNALGLLPPEGTDTVLGRGASRTRKRLNNIRKEASKTMRQDLTFWYRWHYMKWEGHVCRGTDTADRMDKFHVSYPFFRTAL